MRKRDNQAFLHDCPCCAMGLACPIMGRGMIWEKFYFAPQTRPCLASAPAKCCFDSGRRPSPPHFAEHFPKLTDLLFCGLIGFFFDLDFDFLLVQLLADEGRKLLQNVFGCGFSHCICVITKISDVLTMIGIALHASFQVHLVAKDACPSAP